MSFPPVQDLLPHAGAMCWLTRVVSTEGDRTHAEAMVTSDWALCRDGQVPAVAGLELIAQAAAAHAALRAGEGEGSGFVVGVPELHLDTASLSVGDRVDVEVHVDGAGRMVRVEGAVRCGAREVARGVLTVVRAGGGRG